MPDSKTCKVLWKSAVEHHSFFRLTERLPPQPKKKLFFRLRSRFQASFTPEHKLHQGNLFGSSSMRKRKNVPVAPIASPSFSTSGKTSGSPSTSRNQSRSSSFRRIPSKRFVSRSSFSKRSMQNKIQRNVQESYQVSSNTYGNQLPPQYRKPMIREQKFNDYNKPVHPVLSPVAAVASMNISFRSSQGDMKKENYISNESITNLKEYNKNGSIKNTKQ